MSESLFNPRVIEVINVKDISDTTERKAKARPSPDHNPKGFILFGEEAQLDTSYPVEPNSTQLSAVIHYTFGRSGYLETRPALKSDWKRRTAFRNPVTVSWRVPLLTLHATMRLLHGYRSRSMDDKWFIYADGPIASSDGTTIATVHFHRSWTGYKVAELAVTLSHPESPEWTGEITRLTYEGELALPFGDDEKGVDTPEQLAKFLVVVACSHVLGVVLDPPDKVEELRGWRGLEKEIFRPWDGGTMYRAAGMSAETEEDWQRLGSDPSIIRLSGF
ncbi:hypothetical protein B0T14DRAFT_566935 [Immersiella caudata]|uniref:Uncharacterized protein n=1 Tax=Immersiella caudata TaxID=314043 RepID=A0AA39WRJ1_9PEZI|nr:hypothetical protein B0T14DRAFT_566935 [Immersiella caudata]